MKALVCQEPYSFAYQDLPEPVAKPNEVVIKVAAVGICGTDIHAYAGNQPFFSYPRILGHEVSGRIISIGREVKNYQVGQRIALMPYLSCGRCDACLSGKTNCCEKISVMGVHQDGGFCDFLAIPETNILPIDDSVDYLSAALIEPFAISAHAIRRAALQTSDDVLIVGAGPIGLGAAAIAAADGANVVVADTREERRQYIEKHLNLPTVDPINQKIEEVFHGCLPLVVIDATGNQKAMNNAVNLIRHGGRIVFVGLFKGNLEIHDPDFHKKETTLMGSRNATYEDFAKVQRLMAEGKLRADMMLTHTFKFDELAGIYEEQVIKNPALLKSVVLFE